MRTEIPLINQVNLLLLFFVFLFFFFFLLQFLAMSYNCRAVKSAKVNTKNRREHAWKNSGQTPLLSSHPTDMRSNKRSRECGCSVYWPLGLLHSWSLFTILTILAICVLIVCASSQDSKTLTEIRLCFCSSESALHAFELKHILVSTYLAQCSVQFQ